MVENHHLRTILFYLWSTRIVTSLLTHCNTLLSHRNIIHHYLGFSNLFCSPQALGCQWYDNTHISALSLERREKRSTNVLLDQVTYPGWSACRTAELLSRSFSSELPASRWEIHNGRGKLPRALSFQAATNPMIIPSINLGEWAGSHLPAFELPHLCQGYFVQNDKHYPLILFCTSHIFPPKPRLLESFSLSSFWLLLKRPLKHPYPVGLSRFSIL